MVNEINKSEDSLENDQLGERLAASNQALAEMQAEHRQLLEEMEQLRKRAEDLQRLREQQDREEEERLQQYQQSLQEEATATDALVANQENPDSSASEQPKDNDDDKKDEDPEEAEYIKEKLAEIARLKAQFKRVQHMINTTEMIEKHVSKNEMVTKPAELPKPTVAEPPKTSKIQEAVKTIKPSAKPAAPVVGRDIATILASTSEPINLPEMPSMADLNAASTQDEKEQLLHTMLSMFEGFSSDLKSQADTLRAERERIRELKESIIRSRKQPPK